MGQEVVRCDCFTALTGEQNKVPLQCCSRRPSCMSVDRTLLSNRTPTTTCFAFRLLVMSLHFSFLTFFVYVLSVFTNGSYHQEQDQAENPMVWSSAARQRRRKYKQQTRADAQRTIVAARQEKKGAHLLKVSVGQGMDKVELRGSISICSSISK